MQQNKNSLITLLSKVKDNRRSCGKRHELIHILVIVILATMSGYEGYRGIESFIDRYEKELISLLNTGRKEAPSLSTVRRVLMGIDFNQLSFAFYKWIKPKVNLRKSEWLNCDGKGIKGTVTGYNHKYQNFVNVVSIYCSRMGVALAAKAMNNKETSEIIVLRELIESLDLKGVILTADAIHCQKKTIALITKQGNDYVLKVKKNQKLLLKKMQAAVETQQAGDMHLDKEMNRGRYEERQVEVYNAPSTLINQWENAKSIIYVKRTSIRKDIKTSTESFYLSSIKLSAKKMAVGIRSHWSIENQLHYVKDVVTREDAVRIKQTNAAGVLALIRNGILNAYRINGHWSIKSAIRKYGGNIPFLLKLLE